MPLIPILILLGFVTIFGIALVVVSGLLGPKPEDSDVKNAPYECGHEVPDAGNTRISVKFYLTAILFILFDIEIIFMYPWAVAYGDFLSAGSGLYILLAMGFFLAIFIFGLFWELKSKALEWD